MPGDPLSKPSFIDNILGRFYNSSIFIKDPPKKGRDAVYLYKLEIELADRLLFLVLAADNDETAFDYIEDHLARAYTVVPEVKQAAIVEKKRVTKGAGYLLSSESN